MIEHVFVGCQMQIQAHPMDPTQFQIVIVNPHGGDAFRYPLAEADLRTVKAEIERLLGEESRIAIPNGTDIANLNGKGNLN